MSKQKFAPPQLNPAQKIVQGISGPISNAALQTINPVSTDAYAQRAGQQLVQGIRGGYGARGLAGSGIAQRGEAEGLSDLNMKLALEKEKNVIGLLGTAGSGVSSQSPIAGRGFMGLK